MAGVWPIRIISFLLLAASGAMCQDADGRRPWESLPDAPSAKAPAQERMPLTFPQEGGLTDGVKASNSEFTVSYNRAAAQKEPGDFLGKYLYPSLLKRNLNYHPSSSTSLLGRASYAASRVLVTRDESGRGRLNTSYFVGVLSSAAVQMAYRPYWNRSATAPISNFGATLGNDAGMNILHEFKPGLEQLVKNHAPRFVTRIEERFGHN
jgi:hypothetical protein